MPRTNLTDHQHKVAAHTWQMMKTACEKKGMARVTHKGRRGYFLPTTVASFVWAASSAVGGEPLSENDVDQIRSWLKESMHVVVVEPIGNKYKIFVAMAWAEQDMPKGPDDAIDKRAKRLRPEEVGEDRAPSPVTVRKVNSRADDIAYVTESSRIALLWFLHVNGRVTYVNDGKGIGNVVRQCRDGVKALDPSANWRHVNGTALYDLEKKEKVRRKMRNARDSEWVEITPLGREVMRKAIERGYWTPPDEAVKEAQDKVEQPVQTQFEGTEGYVMSDYMVVIDQMVRKEVERRIEESDDDLIRPGAIAEIIHDQSLSPFQMLSRIEEMLP